MARKPEPPLVKIARHLDPKLTPAELEAFLAAGETGHLIWVGQHKIPPSKPPRPWSESLGTNPARILAAHIYGHLDEDVHMRNGCGVPNCVNPAHFTYQGRHSFYHDRIGKPPQQTFNEDEVGAILELLFDGTPFEEISAHPLDLGEAMRRWGGKAPAH